MSFHRNAELYGESEPADYLYKVLRGAVRTYKVLVDGRRQVSAFYLPGDTLGVETGASHAFSAEAVVDTKVLVIKRSVLTSLAASDEEVSRELWLLLCRELEQTQMHVLLLIKTAPERVASFLLGLVARMDGTDQVELPMGRQDIADHLGLTIETISRTLTRLELASAIALPSPKCIVVHDRAVLRTLTS